MEIVAFVFVNLLYAYLIAGLLFGLWYVFRGVSRMDSGMQGARWNLRLLLLPGSMALWPVLLKKYLKSKDHGPET